MFNMREMALSMHELYLALREAGFSPRQAIYIVAMQGKTVDPPDAGSEEEKGD